MTFTKQLSNSHSINYIDLYDRRGDRISYANKRDIFYNCFGKSATGGGTYSDLIKKLTDLKTKEILRIDTNGRVFPILKLRIKQLTEQYGSKPEEIEQVYNHILMEMLK